MIRSRILLESTTTWGQRDQQRWLNREAEAISVALEIGQLLRQWLLKTSNGQQLHLLCGSSRICKNSESEKARPQMERAVKQRGDCTSPRERDSRSGLEYDHITASMSLALYSRRPTAVHPVIQNVDAHRISKDVASSKSPASKVKGFAVRFLVHDGNRRCKARDTRKKNMCVGSASVQRLCALVRYIPHPFNTLQYASTPPTPHTYVLYT